MKKSDVIDKLVAMEQKYFDLVWLARSRPEDGGPRRGRVRETIRTLYPDEVGELSGDNSDWQHGFHSGCLASLRLAIGLLGSKMEQEMAERDFPMLDS
jgi:hypothetical protein